jgi:phosphoglycolate phosphatase
MNRFQHVIWDWNGTLLDDIQACVDAINILLKARSFPEISRAHYLDVFDFPVRNYYLKLGFDFSRDNWQEIALDYHKAYAMTSPSTRLRQGAQATLSTLHAQGIGMSILSACELKILERMVSERKILPYFDHIYGLNDLYANSKIDLGHAFFHNTGIAKNGTILIGDTTHDFEVAQALGIPCLLIEGGHQAPHKLAVLDCPLVPDFQSILDFITGT